jgi:hypothetical protein
VAATPGRKARPDNDLIRSQWSNLTASQQMMAARQREAQEYESHPPGYCRVFALAKPEEAMDNGWEFKTLFLALVAGVLGAGLALGMVVAVEFMDERLKTAEDLKRVTGLPLLASLGDVHKMSSPAQMNWAFRTWTALQCHLSPSPNHGLVCGIISCNAGEGRSTWVNLLAQAASQCGFRVLTVGTVHVPETGDDGNMPPPTPPVNGKAHKQESEPQPETAAAETPTASSMMLDVLASPTQVTQKLTSRESSPFVHIPLPGWVWNLERRKQWQSALIEWRKIANVVIFVELPPATEAESVLLATNLPNLLWLARSGKPKASDTQAALKTLRDARCNLVGSVLNDQAAPPMKRRFSRWMSCWTVALLGLLALTLPVGAQAPAPTNAATVQPLPPRRLPPTLSVSNSAFSFSALQPTSPSGPGMC